MCNRYSISTSPFELANRYQASLFGDAGAYGDPANDVFPGSIAPAVMSSAQGQRELRPMQFSFSPPGCPTPSDPKRPLNNARIESAGKWPWKDAFRETRCVLPLNSFREPCYWGPTAGSEVSFQRPKGDLLHVAGIYRVWKSPDHRHEQHTMAFLMRPASTYVMEHGHHRQPLFLCDEGIDPWTAPTKRSTAEMLDLLHRYAENPELTYHHVRDMAPSWVKRKATKIRDRDKQRSELGQIGFPFAF
ncbi:SOS response-associated peptidase [Novipirellula artificiosorum]|uniref:Abasic site processing protein n=1 Tax=Novipirellula artificiosorum TaxID=2528016 RepID=A0A5C6DDS5_9BACT|nr:SOS response-associated peptidase family protein [Novipirellula artificiosorum]TWU34335.1 hypothetical protein Poly41_44820 [Novipirellula artificiosorum]